MSQGMRCYICDRTDSLKPVTVEQNGQRVPIHNEATLQLCTYCGNTCHYVDPSNEEKVREYYRKEYRPRPTVVNLTTTTHKLNYIRVFLKDFLQGLGDKRLKVGEVGSATGYVLNFFRQMGHGVSGSELTLTFRRMSEHYYGIPLAEELETKHRYDLIVVYHVLEHLVEPDKKLAHFASLLAPGGKLMVATPEWYNVLEEASGQATRSFDELFHKNHINLFSATSIQNLFRKCGLVVVKEDHRQYGQTYLLEKGAEVEQGRKEEQWLTREDPREILRIMLNHKKAIELFAAGDFRGATELVPKFPEAWLGAVFAKNAKDLSKQNDLFAQAEKHVGENGRILTAKAQWLYNQGRLAEAVQYLREVISFKPNEDVFMLLGYACSQLGRNREAIEAFQTAQAMDPRKWGEAQTWILNITSSTPTWDERALEEARNVIGLSADSKQKAQEAATGRVA